MNEFLRDIAAKNRLWQEDLTDILAHLREHLPEQRLAVEEEQGPSPMDTIGSLIDKLITVDLKMWHNQERLYEIRRMTPELFLHRYGNNLEELHDIIKRCCDLNVQRATLMDAIDQHLADIVSGERPADVRLQHKTY